MTEVPQSLFKYTSADTAKVVLISGKLRWSSPDIFNDPAEFRRLPEFSPPIKDSMNLVPRLIVDAAAGDAEIDVDRLCGPTRQLYNLVHFGLSQGMSKEDFLPAIIEEDRPLDELYHERLREFFGENFTKQARVLCLTANPLNLAMWANYADGHRGVLLEFCHLAHLDTPLQEAKAVTYSEAPPAVGSGVDFILYNSKEFRERTIDSVCFTKRIEWQYEQEWRVVTWRSNEADSLYGDYPFYPRELASVTFGLRTDDETVEEIAAILRVGYPHARMFRLQQKHGEVSRAEA